MKILLLGAGELGKEFAIAAQRLGHTVLIGADADGYRTATTAYAGLSKYDSVNIFDPARYATRADIPALKSRTVTTAPITRYGVYAQDLLAVGEKLHLLLGLRYTHQETGSEVRTLANDSLAATETRDGAATPRLGILYQPLRSLSLFASYGTSFTLNTGVDVSGPPCRLPT